MPLAADTQDEADAEQLDPSYANELAADMLLRFPEPERHEIVAAGEQIRLYMASFPMPADAINSIQLPELE